MRFLCYERRVGRRKFTRTRADKVSKFFIESSPVLDWFRVFFRRIAFAQEGNPRSHVDAQRDTLSWRVVIDVVNSAELTGAFLFSLRYIARRGEGAFEVVEISILWEVGNYGQTVLWDNEFQVSQLSGLYNILQLNYIFRSILLSFLKAY